MQSESELVQYTRALDAACASENAQECKAIVSTLSLFALVDKSVAEEGED